MHKLYDEEMFTSLKGQIKKRTMLALSVLLVFLAAAAFTVALDDGKENRPIIATTVLVICAGCSFLFLWEMTVQPLRCYARHMNSALHGRTHAVRVIFDSVGANDSMVDGVRFRDLIFLGDSDKHGDRERLFYWDRELPLPDFQPGQEIDVTYYDRFMTGYEVVEKAAS